RVVPGDPGDGGRRTWSRLGGGGDLTSRASPAGGSALIPYGISQWIHPQETGGGTRGEPQRSDWELSASAMALASRRRSATRRSTRAPVTRSAMEAIDRAARGRDPRIRRGTATAHEPWANRPGLWTKPSMRA